MKSITKAMGSAAMAAALTISSPIMADEAKSDSTWENWYNIAIQYGYTWSATNDIILGYGSDSDDRHQVRLEFENLWKYGENYFFLDMVAASSDLGGERPSPFGPLFGDGKEAELYGVLNSNLSLQKVMGWERGLIDVALEGRAEFGTFFDYDAWAVGASVYLNVPGFVVNPGDKIQFTWWHRWNDDNFASAACFGGAPCVSGNEERYADHNLLGITIRKEWDMFNMRWQHQTFFRMQLQEDRSNSEVQRFDRIFWESEIFAYVTDRLSIGFRSEYFWDDGGIDKSAATFAVTDKSDWRPIIAIKYDLGRSD